MGLIMTKEISSNPNVFVETIEVNGAKLRRVKAEGLICLRDVLNEIGVGKTDYWIDYLSNDPYGMGVVIKRYNIGKAGKAAFTNEAGLTEILKGSRKGEARVKLHNIINALKERITTCPYCSTDLRSGNKELKALAV